jgi:ankyrin repeat protein
MLAAERGHYTIAETLLDKGADKDAKDRRGKTATTIAGEKEHNEIARLLKGPEAGE